MLEAMGQGIANVFSPVIFLWILIGVAIGLIVGILPGIGPTATVAILLPVLYGKDPILALPFLIAIYAVAGTGGPITSILFGIPGEVYSAATVLDGYLMAQQGKAGRALGNALMASALGGFFGAFVMAALIPVVRPVVLAFGSPELFMMGVLGISFVAVLGRASMTKALVAACLGVLMVFVGLHAGTGALRYTMGNLYLYSGLRIVPVVMGMFALPEVIDMMVKGGAIAKVEQSLVKSAEVVQGIKDVFRHWWLVLRCSAIGSGLGLIPGIGSAVATWLCYAHAKQTSKRASEFGHGCEEGVIAPEAADNAKEGGSLLTALAFGVPSGAGMAILLGALMMLGLEPGQEMLTKHLDLVWTIIITLIVANAIGAGICMLAARDLAKVTFVRESILVPLILLFVILGAYGVANDVRDVILTFAIGGIACLMQTFGYSRVTLVIGFVLGDYVERYFLISLGTLGPGFVLASPIACCLLVLIIFGLGSGGIKRLSRRLWDKGKGKKVEVKVEEREEIRATRGSLIFAITLVIVFALLLVATLFYPAESAIFPLIVISIALILLASRILPREVFALREKKESVEAGEAGKLRGKYLAVGIWLTMTLVMLWLLGFLVTVILLPFLYLRGHNEKWLLSISLPLGFGIWLYALFVLVLKMPLYKGLLFSLIFG